MHKINNKSHKRLIYFCQMVLRAFLVLLSFLCLHAVVFLIICDYFRYIFARANFGLATFTVRFVAMKPPDESLLPSKDVDFT